jgi:hypothetical protein
MLVTPAGQAARPDDIWVRDIRVSGVPQRAALRRPVRKTQTTVVVALLVAASGVATFDLYLLATSGFH